MNMKRALAVAVMLAVAPAAMAYQVTGPVVEVSDSAVVVQKGKEKWEIKRDANTKVKGDLKKGAKVTVNYTMTATSIDVAGGKKDDKKDEKKK
jgi:cytochrome c1